MSCSKSGGGGGGIDDVDDISDGALVVVHVHDQVLVSGSHEVVPSTVWVCNEIRPLATWASRIFRYRGVILPPFRAWLIISNRSVLKD